MAKSHGEPPLDDPDAPEPVFTSGVCSTWAQILLGCAIFVWIGRRMLAEDIWEGAVVLFGVTFFWVFLFGVTIYVRYRRVREYRARRLSHQRPPQ